LWYRITRDRAGGWHIAFAVTPEPVAAPGTGEVVGVDRGVSVAVALSTGQMTSPAGLSVKESERLLRLQRRLARADVNAARIIAAGHAVTARGDRRVLARSVKREPQHARPPKVA